MRPSGLAIPSAALGGALAALGAGGCIHDTDCGICDPANLVLESISGTNFASEKIHLLGPECIGPDCPGTIDRGHYFTDIVVPCEATDEAKSSPRGPEEYCRLSPLVTAFGLEFVFNNLLDPTTVELVRKRPDSPKQFEVFDWRTDVLHVEGPITRFNGDVDIGANDGPRLVSRAINLACIDNLRDAGIAYDASVHADPDSDPCNSVREVDGRIVPMKMRIDTPDAKVSSYPGALTRGSAGVADCSTPSEGPDDCCSECDWLLSTKIAKYGVTDDGTPRTPNFPEGSPPGNAAIACDPAGDAYADCRGFIAAVDRGPEVREQVYHWSCDPSDDPGCQRESFVIPRYDKLRETHPDDRPAWIESRDAACTSDDDCTTIHGLDGSECIGATEDGAACDPDGNAACTDGVCRPPWFVACRADIDTTGPGRGFCVDTRFSDRAVGGCYTARAAFEGQCDGEGHGCDDVPAGRRLSWCGAREGSKDLSAAACCQDSLGATIDACDPALQSEIRPLARYDRDRHLPSASRKCLCVDDPDDDCVQVVDQACRDGDGNIRPELRGRYAVPFVDRTGGVVYDPAIKGFIWRPADVGSLARARLEECAEDQSLIAAPNRHDGWRANDGRPYENYEDFDRAMCSGSRYTVHFGVPGDRQFVRDKAGNDLEGRAVYAFETSQFHVVPKSGSPPDGLRIGACDTFRLRFSNRYDLSPENLRKLAIWRVQGTDIVPPHDGCAPGPIAGGPACVATREAAAADPCAAPCLQVDVRNAYFGEVAVALDSTVFHAVLEPGQRYRLAAPGLARAADIADPAAYRAAFWDACGMPLVIGESDGGDFVYDFDIDEPKCREDPDRDKIPDSCDNADDVPNSDQDDFDGDAFGDVVDLCPFIRTTTANTDDSDDDGVGNTCDVCRLLPAHYNLEDATVPYRMRVTNNPSQRDSDGDGIGDACDNCVTVANCADYDADDPWVPGRPLPVTDVARCQGDDDQDMIGNACEGLADGAGPVGFGDDDDFDQDGIVNIDDKCPRIPVAPQSCGGPDDCPIGSVCEPSGVCNHTDSERNEAGEIVGDGVGDECDTCVHRPNPMQAFDESGRDSDDADHDFIGQACEADADCAGTAGSEGRPFAFYEISSAGYCCTVALVEDQAGNLVDTSTGEILLDPGVRDPDSGELVRAPVPVRLDCEESEQPLEQTCRKLRNDVAQMPGMLTPPPGCEEALGGLAPTDNPEVELDPTRPIAELWTKLCMLPPRDQDYDGVGDRCDACDFDYDPDNTTYKDRNGRLWPGRGAVCEGVYALDKRCEVDGIDGETTGATGEGGASSGTAGSSGG